MSLVHRMGARAMAEIDPVVAPVVEVTKGILYITQGTRNRAWADFGAHADETVRQVVSAIDLQRFPDNKDLVNNFKNLETLLNKILYQVSTISNRHVIHRLVLGSLCDEYLILGLRQELDDCLRLFQISAIASINGGLSEVLSTVRRIENRSELAAYSDDPLLSGSSQGVPGRAEQIEGLNKPADQFSSSTQGGTSGDSTVPVTCSVTSDTIFRRFDLDEGIRSASEDVGANRKLAQESPKHFAQLARSLHRLSALHAEAGNMEQAFALSQEANDLYSVVVGKGSRWYHVLGFGV